jgi:hypothetical protein
MLWVQYNSQLSINTGPPVGLLRDQLSSLKSIGDNIFPLVGLVDLRADSVLVYDATAMKDSDDRNLLREL